MRQQGEGRGPRGSYAPERTYRAIVDAALLLFEEQGYHATSVAQVVDAAGVTKGAFYHHFDSKEALLFVMHDEFIDFLLAHTEEALAGSDEPVAQLRGVIRALMAVLDRYRANVVVFFQERRNLTGEQYEEVRRKRDRFDALVMDVVVRGIASGDFRDDLDRRVATFGIVGMCTWTYQWYRPDGALGTDAIAEVFSALALEGLGASSGPS